MDMDSSQTKVSLNCKFPRFSPQGFKCKIWTNLTYTETFIEGSSAARTQRPSLRRAGDQGPMPMLTQGPEQEGWKPGPSQAPTRTRSYTPSRHLPASERSPTLSRQSPPLGLGKKNEA